MSDRHSGDRAVGNLQVAEAISRSSIYETAVVSAASTASSCCSATGSTSTCVKSGQDYTTIVKGTESCKETSASSLLAITLCSVLSTGISAVSYISSDQPNLFYGVIISGDIVGVFPAVVSIRTWTMLTVMLDSKVLKVVVRLSCLS